MATPTRKPRWQWRRQTTFEAKMTGRRMVVAFVVTTLSLVAFGPMPYGYYQLMRVSICASFVYLLLTAPGTTPTGHRIILAALSVLYNPVLRVPLGSKAIWSLANAATVVYVWLFALISLRSERAVPPTNGTVRDSN